ncbi:MAG: hypothetical protein P8J86_00260 [Phycisphaerales bacterium]|nr:hypothetical protein [Phycisphaerales bacterium]
MRICNSCWQSWSTSIAVIVVLSSCIVLVVWLRQYGPENSLSRAATEKYIDSLDLSRFEDLGTSYTSERYHPDQFPDPIDDKHYSNYAYIEDLEERLRQVDRPQVLKVIFDQVTEGAETDTQRHLLILEFLHKVSVHQPGIKLEYATGKKVSDPLVLLEGNVMHCGQVAGLAVDLFEAAGYQARIVSLSGHIIAEIWYEDGWHLIDGDSLGGNGLSPMTPDQRIPSFVEVLEHPEWIDALPHKFELRGLGRLPIGGTYARSWRYARERNDLKRGYLQKQGYVSPSDKHYGWQNTTFEASDWVGNQNEPRFQPGIATFEDVVIANIDDDFSEVTIVWKDVRDKDNDLLGYRVFVSQNARQWNYDSFAGSIEASNYWSSDLGWRPEMYESLYSLPPHEVAKVTVDDPEVTLKLQRGKSYYVTVMAFDEYHERAGRVLYLMSNELRIDLEAAAAIGTESTKEG